MPHDKEAERMRQARYRETNRERIRERHRGYMREWRKLHPNPKRLRTNEKRNKVRSMYGISLEEYEAKLAEPCPLCGKPSRVLDHCHQTGTNRAGLCYGCNTGLGKFGDDPVRLRAAANYIESWLAA